MHHVLLYFVGLTKPLSLTFGIKAIANVYSSAQIRAEVKGDRGLVVETGVLIYFPPLVHSVHLGFLFFHFLH